MWRTRWILLSVILGVTPLSGGAPYRGLFVVTMGTKSHMNFFGGVIDALVENGHEVTLISAFEANNPKVRQIFLDKETMDLNFGSTFEVDMKKIMEKTVTNTPENCIEALTNPEVEKAMNESYDYVILSLYFTDCFLERVQHKLKVPFIYACTNVLSSPYWERLGALEFPSVCPCKLFTFVHPLTFQERLKNSVADFVLSSMSKFMLDRRIDQLCRERGVWDPETPSIFDLQKEASFALINSVRALERPKKLVPPTVIYAGGIHIKPQKPLPKDLKDWFDGSGDAGFILFSLGSAVKPSLMKPEHLAAILNVFANLKQRIIWKWDAQDIEDLPANVKLSSWVPQQDVLRHPNVRLFITHGGVFSTQEAAYFGVPVIGMPVFGDQINNVAEVVKEGWGREITWNELTEESFKSVVEKALNDESLRKTAAYRSALMNDSLSTPAQEVTFWVEYAVRHNGAKHMQSPFLHMSWYEIYNMDVWAVVLTALALTILTTIFLIKFCIRRCKRILFKTKKD